MLPLLTIENLHTGLAERGENMNELFTDYTGIEPRIHTHTHTHTSHTTHTLTQNTPATHTLTHTLTHNTHTPTTHPHPPGLHILFPRTAATIGLVLIFLRS